MTAMGPKDRRSVRGLPLLAATLLVGPGCVLLPQKKEAPAPPKPSSQVNLGLNSPHSPDFGKPIKPEQQLNVHLDLARAAEAQEDMEQSLEQYQKALACMAPGVKGVKPAAAQVSRALVHRRMAGTLDRNAQFEQSEQQYKLALKEAPGDAKTWNDMGYSYYLQGKWEQAQMALSKATELDPQDKRAQTNLGLAMAAAGNEQGAFEVLAKAGTTASAHMNLGYVLASVGKKAEARRHFLEAIRIQPSLKTASEALAQLDRGPAMRDKNVAIASAPGPELARKVERASNEAMKAK